MRDAFREYHHKLTLIYSFPNIWHWPLTVLPSTAVDVLSANCLYCQSLTTGKTTTKLMPGLNCSKHGSFSFTHRCKHLSCKAFSCFTTVAQPFWPLVPLVTLEPTAAKTFLSFHSPQHQSLTLGIHFAWKLCALPRQLTWPQEKMRCSVLLTIHPAATLELSFVPIFRHENNPSNYILMLSPGSYYD